MSSHICRDDDTELVSKLCGLVIGNKKKISGCHKY